MFEQATSEKHNETDFFAENLQSLSSVIEEIENETNMKNNLCDVDHSHTFDDFLNDPSSSTQYFCQNQQQEEEITKSNSDKNNNSNFYVPKLFQEFESERDKEFFRRFLGE